MPAMTIDGVTVSDDSPAYLIAEIGNNHQGNNVTAFELIRMASLAGASAVKFQVRDNRALYTRAMFNEPYTSRNAFGPTYGRHRETVELSHDAHRACQGYATARGITWFATPFDFGSADFLASLDVPVFKIASGDLTNTPLISYVARFGKPMIISTGGADIEDVDRAVSVVQAAGAPLCVMQCTSAYPASIDTLNLRVIQTYRQRYPDVVIGYSGHDRGHAMSLLAYGLGARVIEKHVTLDHTMRGTDQAFSLNPTELAALTSALSDCHAALGDGIKCALPDEYEPMRKMQKSLYAARALPAGHTLTRDDIALRCPGDAGFPPYMLGEVIGLRLMAAVAEDEPLSGLNLPLSPLLALA